MTAPGAPVPVVLVHWNQPDRLARTLVAFADQGVPTTPVVVDNDSTPAVREQVSSLAAAHGAEVVWADRNLGFGPAANRGFRHVMRSGSEWVALAPHDALPDQGALGQMLALIEQTERRDGVRVGLACADVGDGHVPVVDPYFGGMTVPAPDPTAPPRGGRWEAVDYPHGTLMLLRIACLCDIGLFDERYFAYCEETDLGLRARSRGWAVGLTRGIRVTNPTMRSGSPVVDYLMHRNTLLQVREHSGRYHASIRLAIAVLQLADDLRRPDESRRLAFSVRGRIMGMTDFLRGRFGPPPEALFSEPAPDVLGEHDGHLPSRSPSSARATTGRTRSR